MIKKSGIAFILLLSVIFFGACSSGKTPQKSVEGFLNAVKAQDFEKAKNYVQSDGQDLSIVTFIKSLEDKNIASGEIDRIVEKFAGFSYSELEQKSIDANNALVSATMTYNDYSAEAKTILDTVIQRANKGEITEDEVIGEIVKMLIDAKGVSKKQKIDIKLFKADNDWLIEKDGNEQLQNILSGNISASFS